jgi:uncharacterized damage-inducible protein DinB
VKPLADLFALNTKLFRSAVAGVGEADAATRPNDRTNSVAFIGGHLVETRAWMARYLGAEAPPPFGGRLEHATGIDQIADLPTVAAIEREWNQVSEVVARRLDELTDDDLAGPTSQRFPGVEPTVLGGVAFLIQHESYHIGQLGYLRKMLGYGAMGY